MSNFISLDGHNNKSLLAQHTFNKIKSKGLVSLKPKSTSHFFRDRVKKNKLDLTSFNKIISIDIQNKIAHIEGSIRFYDFAGEALKSNLLPTVIPELRNITVGGTISGLGLESSSFNYGMIHDSIIEYEVLTGNGEIIVCTPESNSDLFNALPNSLGTIGYILSCKMKLMVAKPYITLNIKTYTTPKEYFFEMERMCTNKTEIFIEGVICNSNSYKIVSASFSEKQTKSYTYNWKDISFKDFIESSDDGNYSLTTWDYLWRWDRDVYWTLENLGIITKLKNNKIIRNLFSNIILRSDFWVILRNKTKLLREAFFSKRNYEYILQDFLIDLKKCAEFFEWYEKNISVYPIWICAAKNFTEFEHPMQILKGEFLVDVGIYTGRASNNPDSNYYNHLLDEKFIEIDAFKGLHTKTLMDEETFWKNFNKKDYFKVKNKFDKDSAFPNVFQKAIGKKTF